jgi:carbamoyltransferase
MGTTAAGVGEGRDLAIAKEIHFSHSLGLLYSAFTYYIGFKVNFDEYKVMGLAPYGEPSFVRRILDNLMDLKPDGSFRLNLDYFNYCTGLTMTNSRETQYHLFSHRLVLKLRDPYVGG